MDVTSYAYRISQVKNQKDLDFQIIKARILARSLTDQAFWPSSSDKTLLIELAMKAQEVEWLLAMNYFEILEACKGGKEKPEMEMEGKGELMATGLPGKGKKTEKRRLKSKGLGFLLQLIKRTHSDTSSDSSTTSEN